MVVDGARGAREELVSALQEQLVRRGTTYDDVPLRALMARVMVEHMFQFAALLRSDGTLMEISATALAGGGLRREEVVDRPVWAAAWFALSAESQSRVRAAVSAASAGQRVRFDVAVLAARQGTEPLTIDFSVQPVRDADGEVAFLVAEGHDVEAKARTEHELERRNQDLEVVTRRLQDLDRLRSELVANVSHELRTPLTLILARVAEIDDAFAAARIEQQARVLLKHVDDLLDVARLDQGAVELRLQDVDAAQLVRATAGQFEALVRARGGRVDIDVPATLDVRLDPERYATVVSNLVANAVKWSGTPGRVRVSLERRDGQLELEVADDGPGVPASERALVFERFRQARGGAIRPRGGTGLGLAIVQELVALHNGSVELGDAPEGGALFIVRVPLIPATATPATAQRDPDDRAVLAAHVAAVERRQATTTVAPIVSGTRPLVVLAEDNADVAGELVALLQDTLDVVVARDGDEALALVRTMRPTAVLTDVMMPRMSGEDLLRRMRGDEDLADLPVLVLTARADTEQRLRLLELGAEDVVIKPYVPEELRRRVVALVERRRERERARAAEGRVRLLLDRHPTATAIVDPAGQVVDVNAACSALLHAERRTLLGRHVSELLDADDRGDVTALLATATTGDDPTPEAHLRLHPDHGGTSVVVRVAPLRRDDGTPDGAILALAPPV